MAGHGPGLLNRAGRTLVIYRFLTQVVLLSKKVDSSTIEEANKEVTTIIADLGGKCKPYLKLISEQKAPIGQYAIENGIVNVIHHFKGEFPEDSLKGKYDSRMVKSLYTGT